jgi:hypothetical protein
VNDLEARENLLREALAVLALPADEQVRVNGPGCVACDLLNDFDHARTVAGGNDAKLSNEQRQSLDEIDGVMLSMEKPDFECFNNKVLRRPAWTRLRELAADALRQFGWEDTAVEPFVEVEPAVWRRAPCGSLKITSPTVRGRGPEASQH